MTTDPASNKMDMPSGDVQEPKSGGKKWLLGGCGCLLVLMIVCVGGGAFFWLKFGAPAMETQAMIRQNIEMASASPTVVEAVGEPVVVNPTPNPMIPRSWEENGKVMQEYRFAVSGSDGAGELVITVSVGQDMKGEKQSLVLELQDGTVLELDPDAELELNIDDGL